MTVWSIIIIIALCVGCFALGMAIDSLISMKEHSDLLESYYRVSEIAHRALDMADELTKKLKEKGNGQ